MNSQVSFVMHPEDEEKFFQQILADEQVVLIDGPRWKTASPTCTRSISDITDNYCIIWSPSDLSVLKSRHIAKANDWYRVGPPEVMSEHIGYFGSSREGRSCVSVVSGSESEKV